MFRIPTYQICLEGQSLLVQPASGSGNTIKSVLPTYFSPSVRIVTPARSGVSFTGLQADASRRRNIHAKIATNQLMVLLGGTSDIFWEGDVGAKVYADMGTVAASWRAARPSGLVLACTITDCTSFHTYPSMGTEQAAANVAILADANNHFDGVLDLANVAGLADYLGDGYDDGLHLSTLGITRACNALVPAITSILPSIPLA